MISISFRLTDYDPVGGPSFLDGPMTSFKMAANLSGPANAIKSSAQSRARSEAFDSGEYAGSIKVTYTDDEQYYDAGGGTRVVAVISSGPLFPSKKYPDFDLAVWVEKRLAIMEKSVGAAL